MSLPLVGLIADAALTTTGTSKEWDVGLELLETKSKHSGRTVGADKHYITKRVVELTDEFNFDELTDEIHSDELTISMRTSQRIQNRITKNDSI